MRIANIINSRLWIARLFVGVCTVMAGNTLAGAQEMGGLRGALPFPGLPQQTAADDGQQTPAESPGQTITAIPVAAPTRPNTRRSNIAASASQNDETESFGPSNLAVEPVQTGTPAAPEEDEFSPTGFRIGTFEGNASIEQSIGHSSNISSNVGGSEGAFTQTDVTLGLTSDWPRHQMQANVSGSYRRPFDNEEVEEPSLLADAALRLDLVDGITLTTSGFYNLQTQSFTSSILAPGAVDNPITQNYGGSVTLQRDDRKLQYTLSAGINRETYEDADLGGGATTSQEDQNNTDYSLTARIGYEISPAITPFVEGGYTIREHDLEVDRNGNRRDSEIYTLGAGVELDFGEKLRGEISAGYLTEQFEDPALENLDAITANASLFWSPERETEIGLTLGTETISSITAGESGSVLYSARADLTRQINARLGMNAFASYELETNDDNNRTLEIGVGIEYWVNRFMALTADAEYSHFGSDVAGSDFDELSVRMGVRLQR